MHSIKFRAWNVRRFMKDDEVAILPNGKLIFLVKDGESDEYREMESLDVKIDLCTGLKDKNGNPIFEGDIIKQTYHTQTGNVHDGTDITFDGHHIGPVVLTARGVCMKNPLHHSADTDETHPMNAYKQVAGYRSEVIGNVYTTPHLLEVQG